VAQPFVHLELTTPNAPAAKEFYNKLFGWSFNDMPMGADQTYSTFKPDDGPGGGIFTMPGAPTDWLPYVGVDDVHSATEKAVSLGATVVKDAQEVPGMAGSQSSLILLGRQSPSGRVKVHSCRRSSASCSLMEDGRTIYVRPS
jgi:predicted enzyme related to lactoylglutathione lyase